MGYFFVLLGALCLTVLYSICKTVYKLVRLRIITSSIPGPKGAPILGMLIPLSKLRVQDQVPWMLGLSRQFKEGFCKGWAGSHVIFLVTMPHHLEKILPSSVNIEKNSFYYVVKPWLGRGLITSEGQEWFHDRKLITPTFHFSILKEYVPVMNDECRVMLKCIEKKWKANPEQPVEIYNFITKCALDILCSTSMGIDVNAQEQEVEYTRALHQFAELTFQRMYRPWYRYKWIYLLTKSGQDYYANLKIIHEFTRNVIRKRLEWRRMNRDKLQNGGMVDDTGKKRHKALLDHLLDASESTIIPLSEEKIRQQMDTFMFAGHDTTAAAFAWALFCLGNSPEHQEKVHEELDAVFGDSDRSLTLNDLAELKYLDRVLKESLRMYPSVALIGRELTEEVDLGEHVLPKGVGVAISPIITHRHPDVWDDPEKFDPDRFLPENMKDRNPYAYIPFSAGPRNCIGQKFAQIEEKIMAVHILRKWKLRSVLRHDEVEMLLPIVLKPLNGIHLYLTPRK